MTRFLWRWALATLFFILLALLVHSLAASTVGISAVFGVLGATLWYDLDKIREQVRRNG